MGVTGKKTDTDRGYPLAFILKEQSNNHISLSTFFSILLYIGAIHQNIYSGILAETRFLVSKTSN